MSNFNNKSFSYASVASKGVSYDSSLREYMLKVYNHMAIALGISGLIALFVASSSQLMQAIFTTPLFWLVALAPLGFVMFFSYKLNSISAAQAKKYLYIYSALMGLSLSSIFAAYTAASITRVFFVTASVFGAMSIYGYTTKKDLTSFGSFLIMGLFAVLISMVVNIFLKSPALYFAISIIGSLIFIGLTAYDTQKIKQSYYQFAGNGEATSKMAVVGALSLYMDFINLFIMMLRLFGERR